MGTSIHGLIVIVTFYLQITYFVQIKAPSTRTERIIPHLRPGFKERKYGSVCLPYQEHLITKAKSRDMENPIIGRGEAYFGIFHIGASY